MDKRAGENKDESVGVEVNALGQTQTILPQQFPAARPKDGINIDQATSGSAKNTVQVVLKYIPEDDCKR